MDHEHSAFTTLTFDGTHVPPTLAKATAQRLIKNLRQRLARSGATPTFRYLLSGEYGELNKRPHYHAILFGINPAIHGRLIQEVWGLGFTYTYEANHHNIAYTAGYVAKKADWKNDPTLQERIDPRTGEVYDYQPQFQLMSLRPGLGASAKQHIASWRDYAVYDGHKVPVPRYYHDAWKKQATEAQLQQLAKEKMIIREQAIKDGKTTPERLEAAHAIAMAKRGIAANKREL